MQTDHVFTIGHSHKVCEDYARSGPHYAFISDGCSGSEDSDIGSRVLISAAEQFLLRQGPINDLNDIREIIASAASVQRLMGTDETMLDATLFGVSVDGRINMFGIGDGVIAYKDYSGDLSFLEFDAPSGYPPYPSYLLSRTRRFCMQVAMKRMNDPGWYVRWRKEAGDEVEEEPCVTCSTEIDSFHMDYAKEEIETVAVFSDGVKSFMDANREMVPWLDVVRELMAFKGYKGEFVKRRMQGFLKACEKRGWRHDDDVSMAAVYLGEKKS